MPQVPLGFLKDLSRGGTPCVSAHGRSRSIAASGTLAVVGAFCLYDKRHRRARSVALVSLRTSGCIVVADFKWNKNFQTVAGHLNRFTQRILPAGPAATGGAGRRRRVSDTGRKPDRVSGGVAKAELDGVAITVRPVRISLCHLRYDPGSARLRTIGVDGNVRVGDHQSSPLLSVGDPVSSMIF
jgi:hypothetical protein